MFHNIPSSSSFGVLHYHNDASCYDTLLHFLSSVHSTPYPSHSLSTIVNAGLEKGGLIQHGVKNAVLENEGRKNRGEKCMTGK